jgi:hypothetical protein
LSWCFYVQRIVEGKYSGCFHLRGSPYFPNMFTYLTNVNGLQNQKAPLHFCNGASIHYIRRLTNDRTPALRSVSPGVNTSGSRLAAERKLGSRAQG